MKISVIVPVYNVEKYLTKCIDSIIDQTYKNLEIILVNDGSKDNSGKICDQYKKIDKRIIVIHKENGGLSSARNAGLNIATGQLIGFIDSDDWIEPDYYELLYNGIHKYNSDMSVVHLKKVTDYNEISFITKSNDGWVELGRDEAMESLFANNFIGYSAVNKLYKKHLFDGIRYPEGLLMEDKATTYKLIHKSHKVVVNNSQKYHYFIRCDSIIQSSFNNKNFDSFLIHEELIQFADINYPEFSGLIRGRYVYESIRMLFMMMRSNYQVKEDYERCLRIIRKNFKYLVSEGRIKLTIRILGFLIYIFPNWPFILSKSKCISNILKKANIA